MKWTDSHLISNMIARAKRFASWAPVQVTRDAKAYVNYLPGLTGHE